MKYPIHYATKIPWGDRAVVAGLLAYCWEAVYTGHEDPERIPLRRGDAHLICNAERPERAKKKLRSAIDAVHKIEGREGLVDLTCRQNWRQVWSLSARNWLLLLGMPALNLRSALNEKQPSPLVATNCRSQGNVYRDPKDVSDEEWDAVCDIAQSKGEGFVQ